MVLRPLEQAQLQPLVAAAPKRDPKFEAHGVLTTEGKIAAPALMPGDGNALGALVGSGSLVIQDGWPAGAGPALCVAGCRPNCTMLTQCPRAVKWPGLVAVLGSQFPVPGLGGLWCSRGRGNRER